MKKYFLILLAAVASAVDIGVLEGTTVTSVTNVVVTSGTAFVPTSMMKIGLTPGAQQTMPNNAYSDIVMTNFIDSVGSKMSYDSANGGIKILSNGRYRVNCRMGFDTGSASGNSAWYLATNSVIVSQAAYDPTLQYTMKAYTEVLTLTSNSLVRLRGICYQAGGKTMGAISAPEQAPQLQIEEFK